MDKTYCKRGGFEQLKSISFSEAEARQGEATLEVCQVVAQECPVAPFPHLVVKALFGVIPASFLISHDIIAQVQFKLVPGVPAKRPRPSGQPWPSLGS